MEFIFHMVHVKICCSEGNIFKLHAQVPITCSNSNTASGLVTMEDLHAVNMTVHVGPVVLYIQGNCYHLFS